MFRFLLHRKWNEIIIAGVTDVFSVSIVVEMVKLVVVIAEVTVKLPSTEMMVVVTKCDAATVAETASASATDAMPAGMWSAHAAAAQADLDITLN